MGDARVPKLPLKYGKDQISRDGYYIKITTFQPSPVAAGKTYFIRAGFALLWQGCVFLFDGHAEN
jgi:hypothetical protein